MIYNRSLQKMLVFICLLATILLGHAGCGSDSTSGKTAVEKNKKPAVKPIMILEQGLTESEQQRLGKVQKMIILKPGEAVPGISLEEWNAQMAELRKNFNPKVAEIVPGVTYENWNAQMAELRKNFNPKVAEIVPGVTYENWNARMEEVKTSFNPKGAEVVPGISQEEWNAGMAKNMEEMKEKVKNLPPPPLNPSQK